MKTLLFICCAVLCLATQPVAGQGTAFTYQGRLSDGPNPASGVYDLRFTLHDSSTNGGSVGDPITNSAVVMSPDGAGFTVILDFGADAFTGTERWLQIGVRTNGSADDFTALAPRQSLTAAPYAILAGNAAVFTGPIEDSQLSGNIPRLDGAVVFSGEAAFSNATFSGQVSMNGLYAQAAILSNATLNGTTSITNLLQFTNANVLYVRLDGNDATAVRGRWDKPWASVSSALPAAQNGDTVIVGAGNFISPASFQQHSNTYGGLGFINKTNVVLTGLGAGSSILLFTNLGDGIVVSNTSGCRIENLGIHGTRETNSSLLPVISVWAGVSIMQSENFVIQNCNVFNHADHGIGFMGHAPPATNNIVVRNNHVWNIGSWFPTLFRYDGTAIVPDGGWIVENNVITDCARGIEPYPSLKKGYGTVIRNNYIRNYLDFGISDEGSGVDTAFNNNYLTIEDNLILLESGYNRDGATPLLEAHGLSIYNSDHVVIRGNSVVGSGILGNGIALRSPTAKNTWIQNNYVYNVGANGIAIGPNVAGSHPSDVIVHGNFIDSCQLMGIRVSATNANISGNTIQNVGIIDDDYPYSGIFVAQDGTATTTNVSVFNNEIHDNQPTPTMRFGVTFMPGTKGLRAGGNRITGETIADYNDQSDGQLASDDYVKSLAGNATISGGVAVGPGGTRITNILAGSMEIDFDPAEPRTASNDVFVNTGAASSLTTNDVVTLGVPAHAAVPDAIYTTFATNGGFYIRLGNPSTHEVDPPSAVFRWVATRF